MYIYINTFIKDQNKNNGSQFPVGKGTDLSLIRVLQKVTTKL